MDKRTALITGITGQDGSYLAELLLSKGYEVHGIVRRASTFNTGRLEHLYQDQHDSNGCLKLHYGDLADGTCLSNLIFSIEPDEIYNLGAQSHVRVSFDRYAGTVESVEIRRAFIDATRDDYEPAVDGSARGRYVRILDFFVWYVENTS